MFYLNIISYLATVLDDIKLPYLEVLTVFESPMNEVGFHTPIFLPCIIIGTKVLYALLVSKKRSR